MFGLRNLITSLVFGGVCGFIAGKLMGRESSIVGNIVLGILGGVVGGFIFGLVGLGATGLVGRGIISVAGACVCLWVANKYF